MTPPYQILRLQNPHQEYLNLCQVLFNTRDENTCNAMRPSQAIAETASQDRGLNAYYRGISDSAANYSFDFADRQARWSSLLHRLEGKSFYLAGHGACRTGQQGQPACVGVDRLASIPERFNFMDDYYNLLGTFFFLQANMPAVSSGAVCSLEIATLGTESEPFCHAYSRHNIVLTPISNRLRGVRPEQLQSLNPSSSVCR